MKKSIRFFMAMAFVMIALFVCDNEVSAESYKAGGDCGNDLKWSLDYNGNLYVYGTGAMWDFDVWDYRDPGWESYKDEIKTLTCEKGITSIGESAFSGCKNLKKVKLPVSLYTIDSDAFGGCTSLSSINLPKKLTTIGSGTFNGCTSLKSITLPDSLTNLGDVGWGQSTFSGTGLKSITIPSKVTRMAAYCFKNCDSLETVTINGTGLKVAYQAFTDCDKLRTVKMGSGIITIEQEVFRNCPSLKNVTIGSNVTFIGTGAFQDCTSLKEIVIPDKVTTLQQINFTYMFANCTSLEKVTFGLAVETIGYEIFKGCTALKELYFCGDAPTFQGTATFAGCGKIKAYYPKNSKTWDRSTLTAHGAESIDWNTWKVPVSHYKVNFKKIENTSSGIKLEWAKFSKGQGYIIERKVGNGTYKQVKKFTSNKTVSWTDKSVSNGSRYTYRIYAYDGQVKTKVSVAKGTYRLTQNKATVSSKSGKLYVSWKKNSKATGYQVSYSTKKSFSSKTTKTVKGANKTSYSVKLSKGKTYYVRVRTYKVVDGKYSYGAWSTIKSKKIR